MKKALIYASVASMIQQFNMDNIQILLSLGYEVHVACNMEQGSTIPQEKIERLRDELTAMSVVVHHVPIPRKIHAIREIRLSYKITKQLLNRENYELVHCHSPIGSMICRMANRGSKHYKTTRMIYTAHGFHFFRGGPKSGWMLFYPVERFLSRYTDVLITINNEDHSLAQKKFHAKRVMQIPGVGVDASKHAHLSVDRAAVRGALGIHPDDFLLLSVGEVNDNKNHQVIIRALAKIQNSAVHYAVAGIGGKRDELIALSKELGIAEQVHFLGYRSDVPQLDHAADVFCFPSHREGLGLAAIEAMLCGLPLITSNVHGINDYSINGVTGYSCSPDDVEAFARSIQKCLEDREWLARVGKANAERARKYDISNVNEMMRALYSEGKHL